MRSARLGIAIAAAFLSCATPTGAQEMVVNGKFDTSLAGWGNCCSGSGTIAFDPTRDASRSSLSGSAKFVHTDPADPSPTFLFISRCLSGPALQVGKQYFFGARFRFADGETADGEVSLGVEFRSTTDCTQQNISGVNNPGDELASEGRGTWRTLAIGTPSAGPIVPAGTKSARVVVVLGMAAGTQLTLNVDDVFAAPVGTPLCDGLPATMIGTTLPDVINGTQASDVIVGLGGGDQIHGNSGNDRICGGGASDTVYGGPGDDRIFGDAGADHLFGGPDDDELRGGGGNDELYGEAGADGLRGGGGTDVCSGGLDAVDVANGCETTSGLP